MDPVGIDRLMEMVQREAIKRYDRIGRLRAAGLTRAQAAAIVDLVAELATDIAAEESER